MLRTNIASGTNNIVSIIARSLDNRLYFNTKYTSTQSILWHKIYVITGYTVTQNILQHKIYFNTKYTLTQNILHHKIYSNTKYTSIQNILQPSGEEFLSSLKINTRNRFLVVTFFFIYLVLVVSSVILSLSRPRSNFIKTNLDIFPSVVYWKHKNMPFNLFLKFEIENCCVSLKSIPNQASKSKYTTRWLLPHKWFSFLFVYDLQLMMRWILIFIVIVFFFNLYFWSNLNHIFEY